MCYRFSTHVSFDPVPPFNDIRIYKNDSMKYGLFLCEACIRIYIRSFFSCLIF